jgi:molybdopterin/thiamine biosynthesis adenylyltransferase
MDLEKTKLLVVGAGGIGCELLKNLILTGFTQIEVVNKTEANYSFQTFYALFPGYGSSLKQF